jgi:hypothetical protein
MATIAFCYQIQERFALDLGYEEALVEYGEWTDRYPIRG